MTLEELKVSLFEKQVGVCWWTTHGLCLHPNKPMQLAPARWPNGTSNNLAATFEHLKKQCDGGTWEIENLRLAHRICNSSRDKTTRIVLAHQRRLTP